MTLPAFTLLVPGSALAAHPGAGHGTEQWLSHLMSHADHAWPLGVGLALGGLALVRLVKRREA